MIATCQLSWWGKTEMARSVGNSQMSSISSLMADSSSSRVFAGFFKLVSLAARRDHRLWLSLRAHDLEQRARGLWLSATGAVLKRRAMVRGVKGVAAIMFRAPCHPARRKLGGHRSCRVEQLRNGRDPVRRRECFCRRMLSGTPSDVHWSSAPQVM